MSGNYPGKEGSGDKEGILDRREIYAQEQRWEKVSGEPHLTVVGKLCGWGGVEGRVSAAPSSRNTTQPLVDITTEGTGNQGGRFSGN